MSRLRTRHAVVRELRAGLDADAFIEVSTPLLVRGTAPDLHLDSFSVSDHQNAEGGDLVTSTEYQLKRMIAGGFERLYTLTQNFRAGDEGPSHSPEFTMLEWARAWEPLAAIEADAEALIKRALAAVRPDSSSLIYRGHTVEMGGPWERLTVRDALRLHLGCEVDDAWSAESLTLAVRSCDLHRGWTAGSGTPGRHELMSLLVDAVQPMLGATRPTFLCEWPAFMTSSAGLSAHDPALAERSELFIAGVEVADGFPSLTDATAQRGHFAAEQDRRRAMGKPEVRLDARYLAALDEGLPPGAGMALGVDRLVMVLTGAEHIRDVLPFYGDEL